MATVHFVYPGPPEQRVSAKVTAMQTLASVWNEVAGKFKPAMEPGSVSLAFKEGSKGLKPVDVNTPWRLANIPAGSSLHITSCRPAAAAAPAPAAQQATAPAAPAPAPHPPSGPAHQGTSMSLPSIVPSAAEAAPLPPPPFMGGSLEAAPAEFRDPAPAVAAAAAAARAAAAQPPASASQLQSTAQPGQGYPQQQDRASTAVQQAVPPHPAPPTPQVASAAASAASTSSQPHMQVPPGSEALLVPASAGLGRAAVLVTEAALRAASEAATSPHPGGGSGGEASTSSAQGGSSGAEGMAVDDEDDSFYDLTPEDFAALARAAEARRKEEAAGLKTKAMREAEERAKEESFNSVAVRVRFPDGVVLQAGFAGSEHLSALQELVSKVVAPGTKFHLFTTPPKQVLKDLGLSFYKAGLVPAANVHCGVPSASAGGGSLVRPELVPCILTSLTPGQLLPGQHHSGAEPSGAQGHGVGRPSGGDVGSGSQAGSAGGVARAGGAATRPAGADGEKKVPKWLKLK